MLADDFLDGYLNAGDDQAAVSIVASQKPSKTLAAVSQRIKRTTNFGGLIILEDKEL